MESNPYKSPEPAEEQKGRRFRDNLGWVELVMLGELLALLLVAIAHRGQFDTDAYYPSPLISTEFAGVLGAMAIIPFSIVRSMNFYVLHLKTRAALNLIITLFAFCAILAATIIDYRMYAL